MIKVKKPKAICYGLEKKGEFSLNSDIYYQENLIDEVYIYSLEDNEDLFLSYSKYVPDIIINLNKKDLISDHPEINNLIVNYKEDVYDNILANIIVCQSIFRNRDYIPKFSVFTPCYKTGEKIKRTYKSLLEQTFIDWEWIVIDDSPDNETWDIINEISKNDFRVKPYKIFPITGGNVGLAKHRACSFAEGDWLVELDHDDYILPECLETIHKASYVYPNSGFMYSSCSEIYEDGSPRLYSNDTSGDFKSNPSLGFAFGYSGHEIINYNGVDYVSHSYGNINPITIRYNISMPNHVRAWRKDIYQKVAGHNKKLPVADDFELIVRTFLLTRFTRIDKMLYIQINDKNSTVDNNATDINRRARLIRDYYDKKINNRIKELGGEDWLWDEESGTSYNRFLSSIDYSKLRFFEQEKYLNYIYKDE